MVRLTGLSLLVAGPTQGAEIRAKVANALGEALGQEQGSVLANKTMTITAEDGTFFVQNLSLGHTACG